MAEGIERKIWGTKLRILENNLSEIDLLFLEKNSACSEHTHKRKINRFVLIKGDVDIKTSLGIHKLKINEPFTVRPPMLHQFIVNKNSIMIEIAFVEKGKISPNDIQRFCQGGKFIKKKFYTHKELIKKNQKRSNYEK